MKDPILFYTHAQLEKIAITALRAACIIMETGGGSRIVTKCGEMIATGLGANFMGLRVGYGSLGISIYSGPGSVTRMLALGSLGVNHRLNQAIRSLALRASEGHMTVDEVEEEMDRLVKTTPRHPPIVVAIAVGVACASFGRLLGVDWLAIGPVLGASTLCQYLRHVMLHKGLNVYIVTAILAFLGATISGVGAIVQHSSTVTLAMMASILMLVPGVPATNAQTDIMDGHPTVGSARAVSVIMVMIFATTGIWLANALLGINQ